MTCEHSTSRLAESEMHGAGETRAGVRRSRLLVAAGCVAVFLTLPAYLVLTHPLSATSPSPSTAPSATPSFAALEEEVHRNPSVSAKINLSLAYINGGAAERSIPLLLSVVAEDSQNAVAWNNLCVANTLQRSYDLAIRACQNAIALDPNFQLAKNNLAWALSERAQAARK
jgi:Tfp pilus assembly protein PilF